MKKKVTIKKYFLRIVPLTITIILGLVHTNVWGITKSQVIQTAHEYATYEWDCSAINASGCGGGTGCVVSEGNFNENDPVVGVAYKYGGFDTVEDFDLKLQDHTAGHGGLNGDPPPEWCVASCATGIDCASFIGRCWGLNLTSYVTCTDLTSMSTQIIDRSEIKRGDMLRLPISGPGGHCVLFDGFTDNGKLIIYESTWGSHKRVIHRDGQCGNPDPVGWGPGEYLDAYEVWRYTGIIEEDYWAKTYGGSDMDIARYIQQTSDGGFIITANTESFGAGGYLGDYWVLKLESNGDISWQKTYGGSDWDVPESIIQTSDGGYIVVGDTESFR